MLFGKFKYFFWSHAMYSPSLYPGSVAGMNNSQFFEDRFQALCDLAQSPASMLFLFCYKHTYLPPCDATARMSKLCWSVFVQYAQNKSRTLALKRSREYDRA